MPIQRIAPERYLEVQGRLRAQYLEDRKAHAATSRNLDPALALHESPPLLWDGTEYATRAVSFPEGLKLQRIARRLSDPKPPQTDDEWDEIARLYEEAVSLFWGFLDPKPAENPFAQLLPQEVGALLSFFTIARMSPSVLSRNRMGLSHRSIT